jgi:hypothetical protein
LIPLFNGQILTRWFGKATEIRRVGCSASVGPRRLKYPTTEIQRQAAMGFG